MGEAAHSSTEGCLGGAKHKENFPQSTNQKNAQEEIKGAEETKGRDVATAGGTRLTEGHKTEGSIM